jgi:hypothetical protein
MRCQETPIGVVKRTPLVPVTSSSLLDTLLAQGDRRRTRVEEPVKPS